jgi:phosphoribosyl-AMP cyclohydrolase
MARADRLPAPRTAPIAEPAAGRRRLGRERTADGAPVGCVATAATRSDAITVDPPLEAGDDRPEEPVPPAVAPAELRFDDRGLLPAVVQQHDTGEVLMVAWMDAEALERTQRTGQTWFYSRSREELWHKGATSGNTQRVVEVRVDCDADVLLVLVDQGEGVACHTGERTCFHRQLGDLEEAG